MLENTENYYFAGEESLKPYYECDNCNLINYFLTTTVQEGDDVKCFNCGKICKVKLSKLCFTQTYEYATYSC
jgi:hypothetical protein